MIVWVQQQPTEACEAMLGPSVILTATIIGSHKIKQY